MVRSTIVPPRSALLRLSPYTPERIRVRSEEWQNVTEVAGKKSPPERGKRCLDCDLIVGDVVHLECASLRKTKSETPGPLIGRALLIAQNSARAFLPGKRSKSGSPAAWPNVRSCNDSLRPSRSPRIKCDIDRTQHGAVGQNHSKRHHSWRDA